MTSAISSELEFTLGHYLGLVRKEAGLTQAQLAGKITLSPATISRIEAGESVVNETEREAILDAIGTPAALDLREYIRQEWVLERPPFDHPDRKSLWEANAAIKRLRDLREDPAINSVFIRQIDVYEKELLRYADFLYGREHQLAFIGSVGVGKTTAICRLTGLTVPGEVKLDRQSVLTASGGRTTICEVHIARGPQFGIRIVPRTDESIRRDVEEYAEFLVNSIRQDSTTKSTDATDSETAGTSVEVARAIRNMADLTTVTREENGKKVSTDRAKELALQFPKAGDLAVQILTRMDLFSRTKRDAWYPDGSQKSPQKWLQEIYSEVNNGKHPEFTLPQKIEVVVPNPVIGSEQFPLRVVDTKGIDSEVVARQDLECHFDDRKTVVVLCSSFNNAPEVPLENLLMRAREAGVRDFEPKTVILALPHDEEAAAVMKDDGQPVDSDEEGFERKREHIEMQLQQRGIKDVSVLFFNAKESDPEPIRQQLVGTITRFRRMYCDRITKLSQEVDWLLRNRENEEVRLVFQEVGKHLTTWIGKHRTMEIEKTPVEKSLVAAIGGTRHAGTIRASVRRYGDWQNLDYYHHLAVGARHLAVKQIGARLSKFVDLVKHLMDREDYAPAQEFMERVIDRLNAAAESAYRTTQVGGREAFESELRKDFPFWGKCEVRWGAKRLTAGGKYRDEIRDMTEEQFESCYQSAHELVKKLIAVEWGKIVKLLEEMLQEESVQASTPVGMK